MREIHPDVLSVLQPFVDRGELAGAVTLVADRNRILSLETVGYADLETQTPMRPDALFWVASQTKPVTATALMMLVDEGLVDVEDAVEKFLPEFAGQMLVVERDEDHVLLRKPSHPIKIRNVLSHTSGLPFLTGVEQPLIDGLALRDAAQVYALLSLQFQPDSDYLYSNIGINIAGRIIEVVSGQSFESFLQQRLFDPLLMVDTTFWPDAKQLSRLAKAYQPDARNSGLQETPIHFLHYPLDDPRRFATPGGGLFSTASDIARFCQMILRGGELNGHRYLSAQSVRQMTARQTAPHLEGYGLGWSVKDGCFGHGGAYSTQMNIDARRGILTVFLVQHAGFPGNGGASHEAFQHAVNQHLFTPSPRPVG